jgi:vitamin B12/bleomycin/antimicrobial peptide transport system ATP-binding/permease protein
LRQLLSTLAEVRRLAMPYFRGEERWSALTLLAIVVALELGLVGLNVIYNQWNARFYDSLQNKNWDVFKRELLFFSVLAAAFIVVAVYKLYMQQWLRIRWRQWMNEKYLSRWLRDSAHYRMRLTGDVADNPDQRIAEDLELFTQRTVELGLGLLSSVVTLVSFIVILWNLSSSMAMPFFGSELRIPGYLVWAALLYSVLGTWLAHVIGNPLVFLNFNQQRLEADYRYHLVRVRENGEQIALLNGEAAENRQLGGRFGRLVGNFFNLMSAQKRLTWFTAGFAQIAVIFPFVVVSPAYFSGAVTLGILTQTALAFGQVQNSLSYIVNVYAVLAEWRAVVQRLSGFERSIEQAEGLRASAGIGVSESGEHALKISGLEARLPSGVPVVTANNLVVENAERVLVTGKSGSGKSTLFRAIAGIWPFGTGRVEIGRGRKLLVLPQKPYLPFGRLDEALAYPDAPEKFSAQELTGALQAVGLEKLVDRLPEESSWPHLLSGGEQQRLSLARALLAKPDVLLLDEATSAVDEAGEAALYKLLAEKLPGATIVSIGHRATLKSLHGRTIHLEPSGGAFEARALPV